MRKTLLIALVLVIVTGLLLFACAETAKLPVSAGVGPDPQLPEPADNLIPTVDIAPAVGWPEGSTPVPADGLSVNAFATGLDHPRWLYVLPNGDVLVAETNAQPPAEDEGGIKTWVMGKFMKKAGAAVPSAERLSILRDADGDGVAELNQPFISNLHSPFGMALIGDDLYIANTDGVVRVPYTEGTTRIDAMPVAVTDLPSEPPNQHWTKSLIASPDGRHLYAGVGSNSNVAENGMALEQGRAAIWQINPDTGDKRLFATGLRNPVGMSWVGDTLWVAVNERDMLGSDLVPDYMTSVRDGGFYGWPWSYFGEHVDQRVKPARPDKVAEAIKPDYALGPHTASLGLHFSDSNALGPRFRHGMFVGQHGSWNRNPPSGYKVIHVPFSGTEPDGLPVDVLTGFINHEGDANGRPVGVVTGRDGALLVADDVGNVIWRVVARQ